MSLLTFNFLDIHYKQTDIYILSLSSSKKKIFSALPVFIYILKTIHRTSVTNIFNVI